jgi:septal ring factor EnvC (AmiA/AmiB activator)
MHRLSYRWKAHPGAAVLEQTIDQVRSELIKLRRSLTIKTNFANGLQLALAERHAKIDALTAKVDSLREQNRRLDAKAERLAEMVRLSPS